MIFMIKAISNLTNHNTMHTTHVQAPTPAHRPTIYSRTRSLLRITLTAMLMLCFTANANAQWTDPSTGVIFTPQSGTGGTGDEGWAKGCDGSITTKHGGTKTNNSTTWELVVQASQAIKLTGYTITTANDNSSETGRSPYTWKVQGSNSNGNWTDIDSRTNVTTIKNVNYIEYEFQCSTDNYYTYFRFYITAINGGTYMQYSEFHPIGETSGAYAPGTSCAGGTYGPNNVGYVITNGSVYLGGTLLRGARLRPGRGGAGGRGQRGGGRHPPGRPPYPHHHRGYGDHLPPPGGGIPGLPQVRPHHGEICAQG